MTFPKLSSLKTVADFRRRVDELGIDLPVSEEVHSNQLGATYFLEPDRARELGNRFAILPMEGWDATADGRPTDLVRRRWQRFGQSGAKLIWGGEAVAVRHDGRANPRQLVLHEETLPEFIELRKLLLTEHAVHSTTSDLMVGLQLTHSGRWARPHDSKKLEPRIAYRHPLLDSRSAVSSDKAILTDQEIAGLIEDFVRAAVRAQQAGFDYVDVKHCHGYLGHEFLSAVERPGAYGGSFENRTRFLREIVAGIERDAPGLEVGVRLSLFDQLPFQKGPDGVGQPMQWTGPYPYAFGSDPEDPSQIDWTEPRAFLGLLEKLGIRLVCLTAGSPYYNPHLQRPAAIPPSDGYLPPEDPLVGVARQLNAVASIKREFPNLLIVGSAYSYLQEWLPAVADAQVAAGRVDFVGLGRTVLSYPELPRDVLNGRLLQRRKLCRTFSDCTTGPRNGLVSGCYPLDDFYRQHPDAETLRALAKR
ncbi:MAG TPA: NADH:flavin oxidoreductase [Verrucomicrobiota bacterium]|nr:NADH:flavin oxidoreductase [Verrucomicrobiales bacterium]HRI15758.1 NADH:flavin oxidoreductase [Verrucomicrobiota bacterium]